MITSPFQPGENRSSSVAAVSGGGVTAAPSIICHRPSTRAAQVGRPRPRPIDLAATADAGVPSRWSTERRAGHGSHIAAASGTRSTARQCRSSAAHTAAPPFLAFPRAPMPSARDDWTLTRSLTRIRQPPSASTAIQSAERPSRSHPTGSGTSARKFGLQRHHICPRRHSDRMTHAQPRRRSPPTLRLTGTTPERFLRLSSLSRLFSWAG